MEVLNKIFRVVRISIFALHTLWVLWIIYHIFSFGMGKQDLFTYIFITGFFFASFILFSTLFEKTIPMDQKNEKILGRFVYMFKTMVYTSLGLALAIIIEHFFLS